MNIMDFRCVEVKNFSNNCHFFLPGNGQLLLGRGCNIFLSFCLPSCMVEGGVKKATLILYKTSFSKEAGTCRDNSYELYPLLKEPLPCTEKFCERFIDPCEKETFFDQNNSWYTEIDITHIVSSWMDGKAENRELILMGDCCSRLIHYASIEHPMEEMHPRISLVWEDGCFSKPLSVEKVSVEVSLLPPDHAVSGGTISRNANAVGKTG